jgi:hypothetical protein
LGTGDQTLRDADDGSNAGQLNSDVWLGPVHSPDGGMNPLEFKEDGPADTSSFEEIPGRRGREAISRKNEKQK